MSFRHDRSNLVPANDLQRSPGSRLEQELSPAAFWAAFSDAESRKRVVVVWRCRDSPAIRVKQLGPFDGWKSMLYRWVAIRNWGF